MESVVSFGYPKSPGCLRFLGEKGRIKIPIRTKHKIIDAFKRHAFEVAGLIAEAAERGLGLSIHLRLCRLVKSAEGGKVYSKIHKLTAWDEERSLFFHSYNTKKLINNFVSVPLLGELEYCRSRSFKTPESFSCHKPSLTTDRLTHRRTLAHGDEPV